MSPLRVELELLRESASRFSEKEFPLTLTRELSERGAAVPDEYLARAASLGWFGAMIPGGFGGGSASGSGIEDAAVVAGVRGRHLQPGPFADVHVVASALVARGSDEQKERYLPLLAEGRLVASWVFPQLYAVPADPGGVTATPDGAGGLVLDGRCAIAAEVRDRGLLLVTADVDGEPCQCFVPAGVAGLSTADLEGIDLTARLYSLRFAGVHVHASDILHGVCDGRAVAVGSELDLGALLTAADSVGAMERLLEMSVAYAKERHTFGRPIGAFQAVGHHLADASMLTEASRAVTAAATEALATGHRDAPEIVSIAKSFVSDQSFEVSQLCQQVHGGIGFAWENDVHLYMRRLAGNSGLYGDPAYHRRRVARRHGLGPAERGIG